MLGNQGPNNQLQAFRLVLAVAIERNFTLVLAPFFNHHSIDRLDMRCFEDTLDPEAISHLLSSISMAGFRERCHGRVDAVMLGTRVDGTRQTEQQRSSLELYMDGQAQMFAELNGIHIPSITFHRKNPSIIIDLPNNTPSFAIRLQKYLDLYPKAFLTATSCVAFVYPYGLLGRFPHQELLPVLSAYLLRPREVRTRAAEFLQKLQENETNVICVHWRFNNEWKDFW